MATFLELGLLNHFIVVFPLLLVFVGTYALLNKLQILGDDKGVNAIIAACTAMIFLFVPDAVSLLTTVTPWFVLVIFAIFFMLLMFQFLGVKEKTIQEKVMEKEWGTAHWIIVAIIGTIMLAGLSQVYGPRLAELDEGGQTQIVYDDQGRPIETVTDENFDSRVKDIIFHPKVVGMVLLLFIVTFAIRTLAAEEGAGKDSK